MIRYDNKDFTAIRWGNTAFIAAYKGARLWWQQVSSCFGAGYWQSMKRWNRRDGWKRNS